MRITRVTKIHSHRVFRNFSWPSDLHPFGQFNLIYGWNGCGKTTLSSLFASLQKRANITDGEVTFEIDADRKCLGSQVASTNLPPIRVFNRNFVNSTISVVDQGLEPIYYLGEDSVEKQAKVEGLKAEKEQALKKLTAATSDKESAEADTDRFCIDKAKVIKELLTGTQSGEYNNYDKRRFKRAIAALDSDAVAAALLADAEKERFREQMDERPKEQLPSIDFPAQDFAALWAEAKGLLERSVVSTTLDELTHDKAVGSWVQQGLTLHSGSLQSDTCRFCTQPLAPERRAALDEHFNDAFASFQTDLSGALATLKRVHTQLEGATFPDPARLYEDLRPDFSSARHEVRRLLVSAADWIARVSAALQAKKVAPFQSTDSATIETLSAMPDRGEIASAIDVVNAVVSTHNQTTNNFSKRVADVCKKLDEHYVAEGWTDWMKLAESAKAAADALGPLKDAVQEIETKITDIERDIREDLRPAEELNNELRAYLGRDELRFEVKESGYALTRSGQPVTNLSEGERTAICFLYFLKSLEDQSFDMKNGVVVIDDPVSSLDANGLFSAFGYMKERTKECGQLFVLTHNFAFFRQVKNWLHHMKGQKKKDVNKRSARFYLLAASLDKEGLRSASIGILDPLLELYESEYHYLFRRVYDEAYCDHIDSSLQQKYDMPNVARRLLETFLSFRYPDCRGGFTKQLEVVEFDAGKKTRILRLLHSYSHSLGIGELGHDPSVLAETGAVLQSVLEMIESVDPTHYAGMISLLAVEESE